MRKAIFLTLLITLIGANSYSQTLNNKVPNKTPFYKEAQANNGVKCKMSVDDVLRQQSFDIDHPKSQKAGQITLTLIEELNFVYYKTDNNMVDQINNHLDSINKSIKDAEEHGMNITMFKADIDFIETLKKSK